MPVRSKATIFNAALLRCGRVITGGDSDVRQAMDANYDEIVRAAFEDSDGNLPFGRARETLTSRSAGTSGYDDAYTLPNAALHVVDIFFDECPAGDLQEPWEVDGINGVILLNADSRTVEVEYVKEGLESTWSAGFTKGIQRRLEAVIKDFLEEPEESSVKEQEGDFAFLKAGVKGAKNRAQSRIFKKGGGRLSRARRSRGTPR
jgi:hypothetical protein